MLLLASPWDSTAASDECATPHRLKGQTAMLTRAAPVLANASMAAAEDPEVDSCTNQDAKAPKHSHNRGNGINMSSSRVISAKRCLTGWSSRRAGTQPRRATIARTWSWRGTSCPEEDIQGGLRCE